MKKNMVDKNMALVRVSLSASELTPNGGSTVHVLGGVLQQAMAAIVVLNVVEGHGLEAPPAQREDDGVPRLQDTTVPTVLLQPHLESITHMKSSREKNALQLCTCCTCSLHQNEMN